MKKLYIVMPVINCFDLTKAAFESIKSPNIPFSFILIDNGSTDDTQAWGKLMDTFNSSKKTENNYPDNMDDFIYIRNPEPKSVAASWNQGVKEAFSRTTCKECCYIAILNNDILLHPKTLDHLIAYMDKSQYLMVTGDNVKDRMSPEVMMQMELPYEYTDFDLWPIEGWRAEGPDFSCFMINEKTINVLGWFDENYIGAYCEDQDYHVRFVRARSWIEKYNDQGIELNRVHAKRLSTAPYYHFASQTLSRNQHLRPQISLNHSKNDAYYHAKWGAAHPEAMDGHGNITPFGDASKNWRDW